jgi:hypothetical protein
LHLYFLTNGSYPDPGPPYTSVYGEPGQALGGPLVGYLSDWYSLGDSAACQWAPTSNILKTALLSYYPAWPNLSDIKVKFGWQGTICSIAYQFAKI